MQGVSALTAAAARVPGVRRGLGAATERLVKGSTGGPDAAARARASTTVVARALGPGGDRLAQVRLEGGDAYDFTARMLAWAAEQVAAGALRGAGALGPGRRLRARRSPRPARPSPASRGRASRRAAAQAATGSRGLARGGQRAAELVEPEAHPALDRAERGPVVRGDLRRRQPADVRERDRAALLGRQGAQGDAEPRALGRAQDDAVGRVGRRGAQVRPGRGAAPGAGRVRGDDAAARAVAGLALPPEVERPRARHEPQERAQVAARRVEGLGPPPQAQEDVLHDVLGARRVAQDDERGPVDGRRVLGEHAGEAARVAEIRRRGTLGGHAPS